MPDLSIVIPSIRIKNWPDLINSISKSCTKYSYEIIFVGPFYNDCIDDYTNIKFIRDFGSPNRCQQIGSLLAESEYIHFGSDDCMYKPSSIDNVMSILTKTPIVICNYSEGGNSQNTMKIIEAYGNNQYLEIKDDWVYFNVPFMKLDIFKLFGFNCKYQTTCWGHTDLAARIQKIIPKSSIVIHNESIFECSHMPNITGDHAPIHYSFFEDKELFYLSSIDSIPLSFKKSQSKWSKRFD